MSYLENALDRLTQGPNSIIFQQDNKYILNLGFILVSGKAHDFPFGNEPSGVASELRLKALEKINKQSFIATDVTGLDLWGLDLCWEACVRMAYASPAGARITVTGHHVWMLKLLLSQRSPAGNSFPTLHACFGATLLQLLLKLRLMVRSLKYKPHS